MELLELGWYYKSPIDFEHKQWTLFAYLKEVDNAFYSKIFSPYLLHTEKLVDDMDISVQYLRSFESKLTKKSVFMSFEGLHLYNIKPPRPEELSTIINIVEFAIPLLKQRVDLGNQLHKNNPRLLY